MYPALYGVNQAIYWLDSVHIYVNTALYSESSNIGLVVLDIFCPVLHINSAIYAKTTKPQYCLIQSIYVNTALYSEFRSWVLFRVESSDV